ncbi:MAG: YicC/YloC family endoribonuclease [Gammaproteobacteria bacterium]
MTASMTAFARLSGEGAWGRATWELRSVNHRYLEMSMRLPEELRGLETAVRERVDKFLKRGKLPTAHYASKHPPTLRPA